MTTLKSTPEAVSKGRVLSAQEVAIEGGKKALHANVAERILRMIDRIRNYGDPRLTLDRAVLFTQSFQTTEGQPLVLRWAKALKHIAENIPVTIFADELIVGRGNTWFGRYGLVYGELDGRLMKEALGVFKAIRAQQGKGAGVTRSVAVVTPEDEKVIDEVLFPYWNGKDFTTAFVNALPEETRHIIFGPDRNNYGASTGLVMCTAVWRHSQNWAHDFAKILTRGCKGIRDEARAKLAALEHPYDVVQKKPFLEAVITTCDAMTTWANRYARLAAEMAAKEKNPQRKKELEEIAKVCAWVPENPARTFREAVQAQWFTQMFSRLEQNIGGQPSIGRMDQYFYPYYEKDRAEGQVNREAAEELLQCIWLNMWQSTEVKMSASAAASMEGFAHFEPVTIGGQTADGRDATNELSYVILESARPLPCSYPELTVRIHANTPDRFLHEVAEAIKDGTGRPKVINDENIVPFYLANDATVPEALDYTCSGCCETRLVNRETHVTGNTAINLGTIVEMTLRDGKSKVWKDEQFGLKTGDPRKFATYEDLWKAFCAQLEHFSRHCMIQQCVAVTLKPHFFAAPMDSMLHDLAMKECMDLHRHGEYIPGGIDLPCLETLGKGTAIDSLAAIKHLIYDTKQLTWDALLDALERNWEGKEAIRQLCVNAPKYGNGIEWVDAIGWEIERLQLELARRYPVRPYQHYMQRSVPVTVHVPMGQAVWATPNGRPHPEYLSEGISPSHGMDVKGPTTTLQSIARARCGAYKEKGADLINMKFTPSTMAGEEGTRRLMQVIRTWCELKLWHVQFNIINKQTLLAAQKDPVKYRDLVIRIAGYSAFFVDLSPMQQAEIIARTEEEV
jgi:formate C-acetyltransferase